MIDRYKGPDRAGKKSLNMPEFKIIITPFYQPEAERLIGIMH
jgi:hypothetical protein